MEKCGKKLSKLNKLKNKKKIFNLYTFIEFYRVLYKFLYKL